MTFTQKLEITLLDKGLLALAIGLVGFFLNRALERLKNDLQAQRDRTRVLEDRADERRRLLQLQKDDISRWERSRADELIRETRQSIAELSKYIAAGFHALEWFTWFGAFDPASLDEGEISRHNKAMNEIFMSLVGARVTTAALNAEVHEKLSPFIEELYRVDWHVSEAAALLTSDKGACGLRLRTHYGEAVDCDRRFLTEVTELIKMISATQASPVSNGSPSPEATTRVEHMPESATYQAIQDEGRVEAARALLLRLGSRRYGSPDESVRRRIQSLSNLEQAERLTDRLLDASSWDELLTNG